MGAIHGKDRFQCSGCHQGFSWRLDLANHLQHCNAVTTHKESKEQPSEYYLLDVCFLCGHHLSGLHSEEASFVKGVQKLYHSKRQLIEVLEIITKDASLLSLDQHTIGLCKHCMNAVNNWDKMEQQLLAIAKSIRRSYRLKRKRKSEVTPVDKVTLEGQDGDESEGENEECDDPADPRLPEGVDTIKQESLMDANEQDEKFQDSEDKEYKCDCGKTVKGLNVFVDHQLREGCKVKTNKYPCKFCGSVFSEKKLLIAHKKACTESSLINGAYECDICGRRFLVRGRVETHKRNVHRIGTADQQLCSYCGRTFGSGYNMKIHLAREHGIGQLEAVMCELCGRKCSDRSSLRNHVKNIHGERNYECETCGKKFATPGMRNHHINEMHNNTYNYECNLCGQQFHVSFKYRYHMRKMHNTLQYACDDCGRSFIMRSDLYRHVRGVHMGMRDPKRYPCKICGRLFPSKYKVKRHMSSHGIIDSKGEKIEEKQVSPVEGIAIGGGESTDGECSSTLTEVTPGTSDGTSIDVHHLPVSDIYTGPHITTLTPEILQGEVTPELVSSDAMVVGPMSSLVVSGSPLDDTITTQLQPSQDAQPSHNHHTESGQHFTGDASLVSQASSSSSSSSLIPVQQMIVIQDSVGIPSHAEFTLPTSSSQVISVPHSAGQVISVSPGSGQVLSIPQSSSQQVISVPTVTSQVIAGALHTSQSNFTVSLPQQRGHQGTSTQKLPTIHYQYFSS